MNAARATRMLAALMWLQALGLGLATAARAQADAPAKDQPAPPAETSRNGLTLEPAAGIGVGLLTMEIPIGPGTLKLQEAAFPMLQVGLVTHVLQGGRWALDVAVAYGTSLSLRLRQEPQFGLPEDVHLRYQTLGLRVTPVLRLGKAGPHPFALAVSLGFGGTILTPREKMYPLQELAMSGPTVGAEVRLPLGGQVWAHLGPDLQALPIVSHSLRAQGIDSSGLGVGGHLQLGVDLGATISVRLFLEEFHQLSPTASPRIRSRRRVATLGLGGTL